MKASAPGKIILSGEHSVIYGAPAIATAVQQSVSAQFIPQITNSITLIAENIGRLTLSLNDLHQLHSECDQRFESFRLGEIAIEAVLETPLDLVAYCLAEAGFSRTGTLSIQSDIPTGAGMGSSAAVIAAVLRLVESKQSEVEKLLKQVRYCERLQHGRGSSIDAASVTYGGVVKVESDGVESLDVDLGEGWYSWNSGKPVSSTGQVVSHVRKRFSQSAIWREFHQVTNQLLTGLTVRDSALIADSIMTNHRLLAELGVVPEPVQKIISRFQQCGYAAKVCGAGSLKGNSGGQVLVYSSDNNPTDFAKALGIQLSPVQQAYQGAQLVSG